MGHRKTQDRRVDRRRGGLRSIYFTPEDLDAMQPTDRRVTWLDTDMHGLQVTVYPSGKKTFFHRRKAGYASQRVALGEYPGMTISTARSKAEALNGRYSSGENPGEERRKLRHELHVAELYALWLEQELKPHRRPRSVAAVEQLWRDYIAPDLGNRKLSAVTRELLVRLKREMGVNHPVRANRALEVIRSMLYFAIDGGLAPEAWHGLNPCRFSSKGRGLKPFPETKRKRFLGHDELPRFLAAVESEPNPDMKDFFTLALLTGARRANLLAMRWANLDLSGGTWTVEAGEAKAGEEMKLALTAEAVELLRRRKAAADALIARVKARTLAPVPKLTMQQAKRWRNEARKAANAETYVFPGWGRTGHLAEHKRAFDALLVRAKIKGLRLHDVRRTVGAWLAAGGANVFQIKAALGHRSIAAAAVYAQLEVEGVRAELEKSQAAMNKVVAQAREDAAKVTPIGKRGRT